MSLLACSLVLLCCLPYHATSEAVRQDAAAFVQASPLRRSLLLVQEGQSGASVKVTKAKPSDDGGDKAGTTKTAAEKTSDKDEGARQKSETKSKESKLAEQAKETKSKGIKLAEEKRSQKQKANVEKGIGADSKAREQQVTKDKGAKAKKDVESKDKSVQAKVVTDKEVDKARKVKAPEKHENEYAMN